jgi:hypothetical protein
LLLLFVGEDALEDALDCLLDNGIRVASFECDELEVRVHASLEFFGMDVELTSRQKEEIGVMDTPGGFHPGFAKVCLHNCAC